MSGFRSSVAGCALLLILGIASAAAQPSSGGPKGSARSELFDREVKAARSYLEGWFGTPMVMPPIETAAVARSDAGDDLPGHYQDGVVRLGQETIHNESELRRVLRHELTHAVIDQRTRGNCPHWLQEGIAQFLDGTDVVATDAWLRRQPLALIPLYRIEGPFRERDARSRERAYRESASAVSFLVSKIGRTGLLFVISRLGEGRPFDRALLEAGLSYAELQQAWEGSLRHLALTR
ncbi:MAG: hypothetical protein JJE39_08605 [Vicinamibacteria bacterium]|nr:hypothetical protein [Vicinamibacteria bacterium]